MSHRLPEGESIRYRRHGANFVACGVDPDRIRVEYMSLPQVSDFPSAIGGEVRDVRFRQKSSPLSPRNRRRLYHCLFQLPGVLAFPGAAPVGLQVFVVGFVPIAVRVIEVDAYGEGVFPRPQDAHSILPQAAVNRL